MALAPGTRLGPYEILGPLGAGGMGEVYRARDTRLNRSVAVKILPEHLATDPAFKARFDREARAVSALSHPNICALHDIGEQAGVHFLVMEHLEGETLATRLARGPMSPVETLQVASQICEALALAHRQGVVHRDIKPGNIMLTRTGAKLLDFGLAKQGAQGAPPLSSVVMTEATPLTVQGAIVGTWQYMSPEQLEGLEADSRSDIFAFGAVVYEMMSGRRAFEARSQAGLIAAIMGTQPPSLATLVPGISPALDRVLRRCLAKDPEDRWQSASDLASELKWIAQQAGSGVTAPAVSGAAVSSAATEAPARAGAAGRTRRERMVWGGVTLALLVAVALLAARSFFAPGEALRVVTASILPVAGATFDTRYAPAVSPDGTMVTFVIAGADGKSLLYLRTLASDQVRAIPDTEGAGHPFWSPDSRWIGFYSSNKLKKIDTAGGPSIALCDAQDGRGGTWNRDGIILFQPRYSEPLYKIPSGGGKPEPVTKLDEEQFHVAHRWPAFLPDGRHFLFYVVASTNPSTSEHSGIYLGSLDEPGIRQVLRVDSRMAYSQGHLLYKRGSTLMAQPFDLNEGALTGEPLPLAAEVSGGTFSWGGADFGVSDEGVLAYRAGAGGGQTELVWLDRAGKRVGQIGGAEHYYDLALSKDGRKAIVNVGMDAGDLWLQDLERESRTRFTFDPADDTSPVFSPDGTRVAFISARKGMGEIYVRDVRGAGEDELLLTTGTTLVMNDWSPDGRYLVFDSLNKENGFDLWLYSFETKKAEPWLTKPLDQGYARFSPNGRWIAYASYESGHTEVYVQSFPAKGEGRWQVSEGGDQPRWSGTGKEIFYAISDGTLMAADVKTEGIFDLGTPRPLFKMQLKSATGSSYDVAPDGQRFLANILREDDRSALSTTVVINWPELLRR